YGRRRCLLWGAASMTACMVVFASVGVTRLWPNGKKNGSSKGAGNCMIVFTCFYLFCFATTWAPIPFVVNSETFPLRVKSKCMAIAQACNWIWGFLISFFTPFITGAINFYYGYVFMGCMVFAYFYVFFFVPETKGLSLEEVNDMYAEGVLPWKSASWVPVSKRGADYNA
ncbi:MFS transporter, partial [Lutimaribacter sp. EGI FJ00014]|nr:MFS transporter [Lutimaribacter sp. EGI FJ00014]